MPRVSVVIPAFNRAALIRETLDSVLAQTYRDFEVIVVDDGSTDDTPPILAEYERDARLRVIRQANQGEGAARNAGIDAARGEYVALVDSDDVWRADKLERQVALLVDTPGLAWVYADAYAFDHDTRTVLYAMGQRVRQYEGHIARQLLMVDFVPSPTPVVRRAVFDEVGYFDARLPAGGLTEGTHSGEHGWARPWCTDWDMWLRIAARYAVRRDPQPLAGYRIHATMMSQQASALMMHQYRMATIERAAAFAPSVYARTRRRALAVQCVRMARIFVDQGDVPHARQMFIEALRHFPGRLDVYPRVVATLFGSRVVSGLLRFKRWRDSMPPPAK
ncbi:MAG TPA: glycosyltransferase [Candidatus Margulisiibacteriota bacterium]|nr:glycosyltransferase [Candidatus Margulisiibacteriota bacterium]